MGKWRTVNGEHVYIKDRGENRSSNTFKNTKLPKNSKIINSNKKSTVNDTKIKDLADPTTGSPLEPPTEYGSTVLYSPHSGRFSQITNPEVSNTIKPRYTQLQENSKKISRAYIKQSAKIVRNSTDDMKIRDAGKLLDSAQRQIENAEHKYPEADLRKDSFNVHLNESMIMINNDIQSMKESQGIEKEHWAKSARRRILALDSITSKER